MRQSFWVPNLAGKMDMIPGRINRMVIQADRAGVYRGQCAEYCGAQHALIGQPSDLDRTRSAAPSATTPTRRRPHRRMKVVLIPVG